MLYKPPKHYFGFVPQYLPYPQSLCAFYHCKTPREDGRRWCKEHSKQYRLEAKSATPKIINLEAKSATPKIINFV